MRQIDIDTPHGPARVTLEQPEVGGEAVLLLGHGAGGGVEAPDILAAHDAALALGVHVGRVEQPYRVAGRKSAAPAHQLDTAWEAVVAGVRDEAALRELPLVAGGRSSGARVACRTASAVDAAAVLCLAFPLQPPMRKGKTEPPPSRIGELEGVTVPVLIIQGERDQFGMPPAAPGRTVVRQPGTHALKGDIAGVRAAVSSWLEETLKIDVENREGRSTREGGHHV